MTQPNYRLLLKEKTDLLGEYKKLTEQLRTDLDQRNSRDLTAFMRERGRLINKINRIDQALMPQGSYTNPINGDVGEKGRIADMLEDMEALLNEILAIETGCFHSAKAERESIKSDILTARQHRKRTKGYYYSAAAPARFVDTRIE